MMKIISLFFTKEEKTAGSPVAYTGMPNHCISAASDQRNGYWDALKGIGILAVIFLHIPYWNAPAENSAAAYLPGTLKELLNFPVPLFFFLAGALVNPAKAQTPGYIISRCRRLLIPYLFWSILWLCLMNFRQIQHLDLSGLRQILWSLLYSGIQPIYYFLLAMAQFAIITPWLLRNLESRGWVIANYSLSAVYLAGMYVLTFGFGYKLEFPGYALLFPAWHFFFFSGLRWARQRRLHPEVHPNTLLCWMAVFFFCYGSIAEYFWLVPFDRVFAAGQFKLSSYAYAYSLILLFVSMRQETSGNLLFRLFTMAGRNSLIIYLVHVFVIDLLFRILTRAGISAMPSFVAQTVLGGVTFMISLGIAQLGSRTLGRYGPLLGFNPGGGKC